MRGDKQPRRPFCAIIYPKVLVIIYPLVSFYITMEKLHAIKGKNITMSMAIFNGYVKLPEGKMVINVIVIEW